MSDEDEDYKKTSFLSIDILSYSRFQFLSLSKPSPRVVKCSNKGTNGYTSRITNESSAEVLNKHYLNVRVTFYDHLIHDGFLWKALKTTQ